MSPFESWLFGYAANQIADQIRNVFGGNKLLKELRKTIEEWANELPYDASLACSEALFPQPLQLDDTSSIPALSVLRNKLQRTTIPERQDWHNALMEQWERVRGNIDSPQPFFTISEDEASQLISLLSEQLVTTCSSQQEYFNNTALTLLRDMSDRSQGIDPDQLELASESLLHDIRNRELEQASKKIEVLKSLGSLTNDSKAFLTVLETKLALINKGKLQNKNTLLTFVRNSKRDTYAYDLVISILIHFDAKQSPTTARQFYLDANHRDLNVQEAFYETLATIEEISLVFESSRKHYLTEQELTGMVRGAYRQKDYQLALQIAEYLNEQYPSQNSLVLVNLVDSCKILNQFNGIHFTLLDESDKDRVMSIVKYLTSTMLPNSNEVDKRHLAILMHLLQLTSNCVNQLLVMAKEHLSLLEEMSPDFHELISADLAYEKEHIGGEVLLPAENTLDESKCYKLIEALFSGKIMLREVSDWFEHGGLIRTSKDYLDEYLELYFRTKLCAPKDRILTEQIRQDVLTFIEKNNEKYRQINPLLLLELSEALQHLNLPVSATKIIEPLLPPKPWLSPIYISYLNALMASEKYQDLELRLNAIHDGDKPLGLWHMQACLNQRVGNLSDAQTAAKRAVELDSTSAYSWFLRLAIDRALGISLAEREQTVFCIPEEVFRQYGAEKQLLVDEIAMFINPYLAERIMVDWFVQSPIEVAIPLTSLHFNAIQLQHHKTETNPYTPELCGDGVVYTDGFNEQKRLLVNTDASSQYPDLLSTQSGLGRAIKDLQVGESVEFQQFEYTLLGRMEPYTAAFQLALDIRIKNNDGTDSIWPIKMPENPAEILGTLERFTQRFDKNKPSKEVLGSPKIPLMMKGHRLHPSDPVKGALATLTNPDICESIGLLNRGDEVEKVIIDLYTAVYFALIGVGEAFAESDVEFVLTQESKAQLKHWLHQHSCDDFMALSFTSNGVKRYTAEDMKRDAGAFISNLEQVVEACSTERLAVADTPETLVSIKDAFDITVYTTLQMSIGNSIPLLSVDQHVSGLATALGASACNMYNVTMSLINALSQTKRKQAIVLNLFSGTPCPILYDDVVWLCQSNSQDDIELVVRFLRKYGVKGHIRESNQTLQFITDIAGIVTAREFEGKHLFGGGFVSNGPNLRYRDHVFYHCCEIAIQELDGETAEHRLALFCVFLIRKYARIRYHHTQSELYASRITHLMRGFAQGHFLDDVELINAFKAICQVAR
ncbi:protein of unknown function [Shewanella benthica]|uniref:PIN domain-containing protein n=1 Tax=Shewanella benthica TaxID=43661 RepID=A0A330M7K6_9GAMM|nr:hypothetical protein [Shewanella benthica]SQH77965.1 protein of unknown function [Shewanella benthica]